MQSKGTQRITLREVAQETGFSVNTVSKALRDAPDLSVQTKRLIQDTAKRLGYVVNNMASALRSETPDGLREKRVMTDYIR